MKIGGTIAEYNPFHRGHAHHIAQTRAIGITHFIAVMSGNFVQRGEPACFSKWARTRAALENGVDLVIELPTPFATAPAGDFAYAAVDLLHRLGADAISFGSECGNLETLRQTLRLCILAEQNEAFQKALERGIGHPRAREAALSELFGGHHAEILRAPNNLLALEYLRAIQRVEPLIEAITVPRVGVGHDASSPAGGIASASFLRKLLAHESVDALAPYLPVTALRIFQSEVLEGHGPVFPTALDSLLLYRLRSCSAPELALIDGVGEGLENRILKETTQCKTFNECVEVISSKRYTKARIRRILLHLLLGQRANTYGKTAQYVRVLGMNERGREVLRSAKRVGIPMSPKFADLATNTATQALFEAQATDLYSLCSPSILPVGREFTEAVIVQQNAR